MPLDRTNLDLVEVNVYRQLFWGNSAVLKILGSVAGGYTVLASLRKDWMCDEVHNEKTSDNRTDSNQRDVTFTVGDRTNTLAAILNKAKVFELLGRRYHVKKGPNKPLDIRRIWKFEGRYNDQDTTPIV